MFWAILGVVPFLKSIKAYDWVSTPHAIVYKIQNVEQIHSNGPGTINKFVFNAGIFADAQVGTIKYLRWNAYMPLP